ncbi:MAG TPA: hypothetical protein VKT73_09715 [Xanthobacteraceae bacterium]|nr:hypothetical protein [Xanthobacteraceae bacterium]
MRGLLALIALTSVFCSFAMAQSNDKPKPSKPFDPGRIESVEITEQPKSSGWTEDRMRKAKPLPLPSVNSDKTK